MADVKSELRSYCINVLDKKGWKNFEDIDVKVVSPDKSPAGFSAYIDLRDRSIHTTVAENFYEAIDTMIQQEKLELTREQVLADLMNFIVSHEYGHHQICPRTQQGQEAILAGHYKAIEGREYREEVIGFLCSRMANMFEDTLLNTVNSRKPEDRVEYSQGMGLAYLLMNNYQKNLAKAVKAGKTGLGKFLPGAGNKFDKSFALFLNSSAFLCNIPEKFHEKLRKYNPTFFPSLNRYTRKMGDIFTGDSGLTDKILRRENLSGDDALILTSRLQEMNNWRRMAEDYANIIYQFMRPGPQRTDGMIKRGSPSDGQGDSSQNSAGNSQKGNKNGSNKPQNNKDGKDGKNSTGKLEKTKKDGAGGKDKKDDKKNGKDDKKDDKNGQGNKPQDENGDEDDDTPQKPRPDVDYNTFKKIREELGLPMEGSSYDSMYNRLNRMYRQRAMKIALFAEEERDAFDLERDVTLEEMPLDQFTPKGVDWASTRIQKSADGSVRNVQLYRRTNPIKFNIPAQESQSGIPDLSFIFDTSFSQGFDPFNADEKKKGDYDLACLAFYSILNYLESIGVAPMMNFNVINFSNYTLSSGWRPYSDIKEVKRVMFAHQNGATVLDHKAIRKLTEDRRDNFISFMLSDTDLNFEQNIREVVREVDNLLNCGAGFHLFKIGNLSTQFASAMLERRVGISQIRSSADFLKLGLKFSKDLFGSAVAT